MGAPLLGKHFAGLHSASTPAITIAAAGSFLGQVAAVVQGAPVWVYIVVAVAPWVPTLVLELIWTYRHYRWLAVFCLLVVTQSAYLLEQVARMVQVHVLGRAALDAPGIFGALGIERVQFLWTSWAVVGMLLLVSRFPRNPWLWLTLGIAAWDAVGPMLLGERPLAQANVQFVDSVLEIAALNLAFALQLGRTYNAWLARAFPQLPEQLLIDATGSPGGGPLAARRAGNARRREPVHRDPRSGSALARRAGRPRDPAPRARPGQIVSNEGTLMVAETTLELLALPAPAA